MAEDFRSSLVRVRGADGGIVGAGVVIPGDRILTCAHVVLRALGIQSNDAEVSSAEVRLDLPLAGDYDSFSAKVVFWPSPHTQDRIDFAILETATSLPKGTMAGRLLVADALWGHPFRAFGFPPKHDAGTWVTGRLLAENAWGWVQLEDTKSTGYFVASGFSGGPVWDETLAGVVGIVVASEARLDVRAAFMIPLGTIISSWPEMADLVESVSPQMHPDIFPLTLLSPPRAGLVVDRETLLSEAMRRLASNRLLLVEGLAGIGKTSFASRLADLMRTNSDKVVWITCKDGTGFDHFAVIIEAFLQDVAPSSPIGPAARSKDPQTLAAELLEYLQQAKVLIVIDNFEKVLNRSRYVADPRLQEFLEILCDHQHKSWIVLVSRYAVNLPHRYIGNHARLVVSGLEKQFSGKLVESLSAQITEMVFERLHQAVRGHPLALKLFIGLTSYYSPETLLGDSRLFLDQCGTNLLRALLKALSPEGNAWVQRMAVLRGAFGSDLLLAWGVPLGVVELLASRFLIEFDKHRAQYEMHPLVRDFVYMNIDVDRRQRYHADAARYYSTKFDPRTINASNFWAAAEASYHFSRAGDLKNTAAVPIGFTDSFHHLGLLFFKRREYKSAEECYAAVLDLNPRDSKAHFYYAASIDLQGPDRRRADGEIIETNYKEALNSEPRNAQYLDYYAYFLVQTGRGIAASEYFARGVAVGATCPTLYARYGHLLRCMGEVRQAEEVLRKGCRVAYRPGPVYLEYARLRVAAGQISRAKEILDEGIQRDPGYRQLGVELASLASKEAQRR